MNTPSTHEESIEKLGELIEGISFAMMSSLDEKGQIHSRPMATQELEFDGELWFFTGKSTHKVEELKRNPHVNLSYMEPSEHRFVSVSGVAELVDDREKAQELWNPVYRAWFPKGLDDPELILLRVRVTQAEYWDHPLGRFVQLLGFAKAVLTGQHMRREDLDKGHQKFNLTG